jgi:predicted PurR-regulated permease PerM
MTDLLISKFLQAVRDNQGQPDRGRVAGHDWRAQFLDLGLPGALLWGVAMGVFSLFLRSARASSGCRFLSICWPGSVWQGAALAALGFFVISSVDNLVRPILVGRDTRVPDYVILITTLGGFELMGFNGFVMGPVIAALFIAIWQVVGESRADQA